MKGWRTAALAAALLVALGIGAALAPVTHGQAKIVRTQKAGALEILAGGGRIGVSIRDLNDDDMKTIKGAAAGVVVEEVATDSPAQKAGIRKGDVIAEFDGERIRSARQLTRVVQETPAGRAVQATLIRDGQRTPVTLTPSDTTRFSFEGFPGMDNLLRDYNFRAFKAIPPAAPAPPAPPAPPVFRFDELLGRANRLGVTVDSLSSQLAEYFGTKSGVLVTSVYDDSAAAKAGLKAGDVIISFNGAAVDNVTDVRRRIQDLREGDEFTIEVMRDRKPITLKGKAERTEPRRRTYRTIL